MSLRKEALPWLRLCLVPGLPGSAQRALLKAFGPPELVLGAKSAQRTRIIGTRLDATLEAGPDPNKLETTLEWLEQPGNELIALGDGRYPRLLLEIPDPPTLIYAQGDLTLLNRPAIAIVGSRNASRQGAADARAFARSLSDAGYCIVSGLAAGIDAAAHRGGLAGACSSIAVVGTGPDRIYPAANRELAAALVGKGALISEFPPGTPPIAENFPRRNRIISALALGIVVVEATTRSGSLITARLGLEQGREVFAIPGSIHSPQSRGCHQLIKLGAKLVESSDDILEELRGWRVAVEGRGDGKEETIDDDPLFAAMGHAPASLDDLAQHTGKPVADLTATLTRLELEGRVERLAGGLFRRLVTGV